MDDGCLVDLPEVEVDSSREFRLALYPNSLERLVGRLGEGLLDRVQLRLIGLCEDALELARVCLQPRLRLLRLVDREVVEGRPDAVFRRLIHKP